MNKPIVDLTFETEIEILGIGVETPESLEVVGKGFDPDGFRVGLACCGVSAAVSLPFGKSGYDPKISLCSAPHPRMLCACVFGAAYLLKFTTSWEVEELETFAVSDVAPCPEAEVLALVDFVRVTTINKSGKTWTSEDVSDDVLSLLGVNGTSIRLNRYSAPDGRWEEIDLDLRPGALV
ncbi:hypothetical protein [Fimbriimonas ginsengisoli]|uniref:Uncharacterized protein n=1 Tax=Fimbriimonas ginsengisoli Gsoil 348 TaxID=661478 RepID=A0A068NNC9_FIMGI|nr:hypothetical protein [Fimbriimonas ginsengisoli]AIE84265.1 hypothetical protein OP10G_0897 [Fimbriimonas ginsengisoli Gsoil 348]